MRRAEKSNWPNLRRSEWVIVTFFVYIALITPLFRGRPHLGLQPYFVLAGVVFCIAILCIPTVESRSGRVLDHLRDWLPLGLTLAAFWEMELFIPAIFLHTYESVWRTWDHAILGELGLRSAIEAWGAFVPAYLEFCYLLVYGVGAFCIAIMYASRVRCRVDSFLFVYLAGTLGAYALFPYFPSQPPRFLYPDADIPSTVTALRTFNLWVLKEGTIHSSVFPSAHVSSAFSCAWALFLCLPEKKFYAWGVLAYAVSVSLATVYGRYHYSADVVAGLAVSLAAAGAGLVLKRRVPGAFTATDMTREGAALRRS